MIQIVIRLLVEGVVVFAFAIIGDLLKSKSFARLFGAAPSVEPATSDFTVASKERHEYAGRFFVGGLITAIAGIIAKKKGRKGYAELGVEERQPALMPLVRR